MEKSLRLRKQKDLARSRVRRLLATGKLRREQVSLAAGAKVDSSSPLILDRVRIPEYEVPDASGAAEEARFVPSDFSEVIARLPDGCALVGGQAVDWWVREYRVQVQEQGKPIAKLERKYEANVLAAIPAEEMRAWAADVAHKKELRLKISNFVNHRWARLAG